MSTSMQLELVAALLRQGRPFDALSRGLLLLATAWLVLLATGIAKPGLPVVVALLASLLLALLQRYFALRVDLDARLLRVVAGHAATTDLATATAALDDALVGQGMLPREHAGRAWPERLAGARRLWRRQLAVLLLQLLAFAAALLAAGLHARGTP